MGANVSVQRSFYLLDGYKTYASTGTIRKFTSSEENRLFWNGKQRLIGTDSQTDKQGKYLYHRVTPGHYIVAVKIRGAAHNQKYGTMTITDSYNQTFDVPCEVRVPEEYMRKSRSSERDDDDDNEEELKTPDQWTTEYVSPAWETSGLGVSSIGMTIRNGCTVLTDLESRLRPQLRTMKFDGAGVIGWLINNSNQYIGFISDHNCWLFFSESHVLDRRTIRCRYFKPGFVLSALQWERYKESTWNVSQDQQQCGRSRIVMTAINADHESISYVATQKNILPINNTCVIDNDQFKVLKGLQFLIVPGASSVDSDFMITGMTEMSEFVEPDEVNLSEDELLDAKQSIQEKTPVIVPVLQPVTKNDDIDDQHKPKLMLAINKGSSAIHTTTPAAVTSDFVLITLVIILIIALALTVLYFVYQNYQRDYQSKLAEERKKLESSIGTSAQSINEFLEQHQHLHPHHTATEIT